MCPVKEAVKLLAKETLGVRACGEIDLTTAAYKIFKDKLDLKKKLCLSA